MRKVEHGGIPWGRIFDEVDDGSTYGEVKGYSGNPLIYTFEEDEYRLGFRIKDKRHPFFHTDFEADIYGGYFTLDLHTKGDGDDDHIRHPDMRGGEFIGQSLNLMRHKIGYTPRTFMGIWCDAKGYSNNFSQFMEEYRKGASEAEAAKKTWSGRTVALHGFTRINNSDVSIESTGMQILAQFHRPR